MPKCSVCGEFVYRDESLSHFRMNHPEKLSSDASISEGGDGA